MFARFTPLIVCLSVAVAAAAASAAASEERLDSPAPPAVVPELAPAPAPDSLPDSQAKPTADAKPAAKRKPEAKADRSSEPDPDSDSDSEKKNTAARKALAAELKPLLAPLQLQRFHKEILAHLTDIAEARGNDLLWGENPRVPELMLLARSHLESHGIPAALLNPSRYESAITARDGLDRDRLITACILHSGLMLRYGCVKRADFWPRWDEGDIPGEDEDRKSYRAQLDRLARSTAPADAAAFLADVAPRGPLYLGLRDAWLEAMERRAEDDANWQAIPPLPPRTAIEAGQEYTHLPLLEKHLAREGFPVKIAKPIVLEASIAPDAEGDGNPAPTLTPAPAPASASPVPVLSPAPDASAPPSIVFTTAHADALRRFQASRDLADDGILGPNTIDILNLPPAVRRTMLRVNLERARWLPAQLGSRFAFVNLPAGRLTARNSDGTEISMRVVFGKNTDATRTVIFRERMKYVVFRPYWNVPLSIIREEILPEIREDWNYLARKGYQIVRDYHVNNTPIALTPETLHALSVGQLKIRQVGGGSNALGSVKFLFPNPYSIYMHDTPHTHLFQYHRRTYSHGCIRLEHPRDFASHVLSPQGWTSEDAYEAAAAEERKSITIEEPINVYITYLTAAPSPGNGPVAFLPDVYERDPALHAALVDCGAM